MCVCECARKAHFMSVYETVQYYLCFSRILFVEKGIE